MSFLDQVVGALAGGQSSNQGGLLEVVMHAVNSPQIGGLSGLIHSFQQGGLGEIVNSWVANGHNMPISAEQIQSVLGGASLQDIAAKLGMSPEQASGSLAEILPKMVDTMTPNGQLPEGGDMLTQGFDLLKKSGMFG